MIVNVEGIDSRDIQNFELEDKIHDGETIIGSCYKNIGKMSLINENNQYDSLKGKDITFSNFGKWHIKEALPKKDSYSIDLTLEDQTYKLDEPFNKEKFKEIFPCTNKEFARKILEECNLILGSEKFANSDFILETIPFTEEKATYRDIIMMIAKSASSFVKMSSDKVYIRWFDEEIIEIEDWYELTQENETEAINLVVLGRGNVEDNIKYPTVTPKDPYELRIDDNQILYFNREQTIIPIYNQVNGFKYQILNMRAVGNINIKSGSKICYKDDIDGIIRETYIFNNTIKFDGGYESYLQNEELKETSTKYQYAGTIEKRLTNAEIIVDKQGNRIEAVVQEQITTNKKVDSIGEIKKIEGQIIEVSDASNNYAVLNIRSGNSVQEQQEVTSISPSQIKNCKESLDISIENENILLSGYSTSLEDKDFYSSYSSSFTPLADGWRKI